MIELHRSHSVMISTKQNEAKTQMYIELPAREISIIPVQMHTQYVEKQIVLEPSQSLQNKRIVGVACLVSPSNQQAVMQVINPDDDKSGAKQKWNCSVIQPNSIQIWTDKTEKKIYL